MYKIGSDDSIPHDCRSKPSGTGAELRTRPPFCLFRVGVSIWLFVYGRARSDVSNPFFYSPLVCHRACKLPRASGNGIFPFGCRH